MNWTQPADLRAQLGRLWQRGDLLRDALQEGAPPDAQPRFPLRLQLKTPSSADLTERLPQVRAWAAELAALDFVQVQWQAVQHRVQGRQNLPAAVWVPSREAALACLGKRPDWLRFSAQIAQTRQSLPGLLPWLAKRPQQALALAPQWPQLLALVAWMQQNPRPGIYLRQVDLPGIHSKFIEQYRAVLTELFDLALPATAIDPSKTGLNQFALRYGFLDKPARIRFRLLDPALRLRPELATADVALDADSFSRLDFGPGLQRVFITENEINFLAFPPQAHSMVIFGAGYGWEALARSDWLQNCALYYWGDIDTHGFAILNQLRGHFAHARSFLMDSATLQAHSALWGNETAPCTADLPLLHTDEAALYEALRTGSIRTGLRLEQEHIGFAWLQRGLLKMGQ